MRLGDDAPVQLYAALHGVARPALQLIVPRQLGQGSICSWESQLHTKRVAINAQIGIAVLGNDVQRVVLQLMIAEADALGFVVHDGSAQAVVVVFVAQVVVVEGLHLDGLTQVVGQDGERRVEGVDKFLVVLTMIRCGERDGQHVDVRWLPVLPQHHFSLPDGERQRLARLFAEHAQPVGIGQQVVGVHVLNVETQNGSLDGGLHAADARIVVVVSAGGEAHTEPQGDSPSQALH